MGDDLLHRISSFEKLGNILKEENNPVLENAINQQSIENPWFIPSFIRHALGAITNMLSKESLDDIANKYDALFHNNPSKKLKIAVISAGNIPIAAFHDFFSILITGNTYIGKLSSHDKILLPVIANILTEIEPSFQDKIIFTERLSAFDKIIATGSNNSSRYFEYYFGKYPHILRKNRNSAAILSGGESKEELIGLFLDMFLYFGLGCRSVSFLFIPKQYDFKELIYVMNEHGNEIAMHHPYLNNLDFQKTMHLMNRISYIDGGIALFVKKKLLASPIGIVHYSPYQNIEEVSSFLDNEKDSIQCVISSHKDFPGIPFGTAQQPSFFDFPDNVDTIQWILS